jgi:UDP-N-acetyl-D-mannosaminuronate dehydrogenase
MTAIVVVGLGYVGLPLAVEFGKKFKTLGFDLSAEKVADYGRYADPTGEVSSEDLRASTQLRCSTPEFDTKRCKCLICLGRGLRRATTASSTGRLRMVS